MSILVHPREVKAGFFIDGLAADGHWSSRWELALPWNSWRQTLATIRLNDGRLVILGAGSNPPATSSREVLLITEPLSEVDATKMTNGSPVSTP